MVGALKRYVSPVVIAPVIALIDLALFAGLAIPSYMGNVQDGAAGFQQGMQAVPVLGPVLGTEVVSTTVFVIGSTGMAVGGIVAFVLDNTIEGTPEERGVTELEAMSEDEGDFESFWDRFGGSDERTDRAD